MTATESIKVLIRHNDPLVASGLTATLKAHAEFALSGFDSSRQEEPCRPDVVITDYESGLACLTSLREQAAGRRMIAPHVLIVTHRESEREIRHALEQGARGYLILGCGLEEVVDAVRTLRRGLRHLGSVAARRLADSISCALLTARETDVLRLLAEGHGNKAIARSLDIAIGTVKTHLKAIFQKLDATSRTEVAAVAERRGLLAVPSADGDSLIGTPVGWSTVAAGSNSIHMGHHSAVLRV